MSDLTQEESDNYWDALHPPRPAPPEREILTDLIAELVGMADQGLDSGWAPLYEVADWAEARLREVSDE